VVTLSVVGDPRECGGSWLKDNRYVDPYAAYLRVYEPLSAFGPGESERWREYAHEHAAVSSAQALRTEQRRALASALSARALHGLEDEPHAYVMQRGSELLVCPSDLRLRTLLAIGEQHDEPDQDRILALLPATLVSSVDDELSAIRAARPDVVPHVRQSGWAIPAAWFLLFTGAEREPHECGGFESLRLRTPMVTARRAIARAHVAVRDHLDDARVLSQVVDVGRWLEAFHPNSHVELDSAGLGQVAVADLSRDTPVEDLAMAVAALASGAVDDGRAVFRRFGGAFREAQLYQRAN
jgi:hypothetical protein